jgi:hypothetical protein
MDVEPVVLNSDVWDALRRDGASVDARRGDADDPLGGAVHILLADGTDVDLIVAKWQWEADVVARATPMRIGNADVPVPRTADLILLKLAAGGYLDLRDAAALLALADRDAIVRDVEQHIDGVRPDVRGRWRELLTAR